LVVIQGASGSGKTTLLMTAAGMLRPSSGLVRVLGEDPYQISADQRSRLRATSIGVVLPMFHLLPYLDAADNVALGYVGSNGRTEAAKLLRSMGIGERVRQLPDRMTAAG
jgi:putative ABC transport system ATP-binding protein